MFGANIEGFERATGPFTSPSPEPGLTPAADLDGTLPPLFAPCTPQPATGPAEPVPPTAPLLPKLLTSHGDVRTDDYYYLRDISRPEVRQYLDAENHYTEQVMSSTEELQQSLFEEFVDRYEPLFETVYHKVGDNHYFYRTIAGEQYPIYMRRKESDPAAEEVLLNLNDLSAGRDYLKLGDFKVSPDQRYLAYSLDDKGSEVYTIHIKDLATGQHVDSMIANSATGLEWTNDSKSFYYCCRDHLRRSAEVRLHHLGDPNPDKLVFTEPDLSYELYMEKTAQGDFIVINAMNTDSTEVSYTPADTALGTFQSVLPRQAGRKTALAQHDGKFLIKTNDGAPDFRIMERDCRAAPDVPWREVVAERPGIKIEDHLLFKNHMVVAVREDGLRKIYVTDLSTGKSTTVGLPDQYYNVFLRDEQEFAGTKLRLGYSSPFTPYCYMELDMHTNELTVTEQSTFYGFDPDMYACERVLAPAEDGKTVPVYLMYRKDLKQEGGNPLLLEAYGAYDEILYEPGFCETSLSLMDRGFVCAIAHVRGGGERDTGWYHEGKLLNKRNTITDFVASAEHLVKVGIADPEKIAINGMSAGGMLMTASTNLRPDLFKAVVAEVPFVDALTTMQDPSIPLTIAEYYEWGNPADKSVYEYIKTYSPYDNIEKKAYPAMLLTAGLNDYRVQYWEPAKFVAKMRGMKTDSNPLLLRTNMAAGHSGASGRYDELKDTAFKYAFILKALGLDNEE